MPWRAPFTLSICLAILTLPAAAQLVLEFEFDPPESNGICGIGVDPTDGTIWFYPCSGSDIFHYTDTGMLLGSIPSPGEDTNDVDIEFADAAFTLAARGTSLALPY